MTNKKFIDVTVIEPSLKHDTIFKAFDSINDGGSVLIHNDHDPKPLYYQLVEQRGKTFSWTYIKRGPSVWEVEIKKEKANLSRVTIADIVKDDIRKAETFRKYGIDFCCGGKRTIEDACREKGIDVHSFKEELSGMQVNVKNQHDFNSWSLSFLADYIVNVHHNYVNKNLPVLLEYSKKVAEHHGKQYEYLYTVSEKIVALANELNTHMKKEEQILFPLIKMLENGSKSTGFKTIQDPIWVMESEHDAAGDILKEIRTITNDYSLPKNACNSFSLLMHKLEDFENDLHIHIHLENNILFPNSLELEKSINN